MTRTQASLDVYAKEASDHWTRLEANRVRQAKARKEINGKIDAAEKLESELAAEEREAAPPGGAGAEGGPEELAPGRRPRRPEGGGDRGGPEGGRVRDGPDRQAVRVGRRGPRRVRLLRPDPERLGRGGPRDPAHLAGAVAAAAPRGRQGHAAGRPDRLLQGREPHRDVRRERDDRPRAAPGAEHHLAGAGSMEILGSSARRARWDRPGGEVGGADRTLRPAGPTGP